jgi:hypothetical protein
MIIGVGTNSSFEVRWQSPDLPSPTIVTADAKPGGSGWVRVGPGGSGWVRVGLET